MIATQTETTFQTCDDLRRAKKARRKACEQQRVALAELAQLEQELAELEKQELESVKSMTDSVVAHGKKLLERLLVEGQGSATATSYDGLSTVADPTVIGESLNDNDARRFLVACARRVEFCLEGLAESLAVDDSQASGVYCEQARRLTGALREIQDSWPWVKVEAIAESWSQYERGELIDFETFKHELLKATK